MQQESPPWSSALDRVLLIGCAAFLTVQSVYALTALVAAQEVRTMALLTVVLIGRVAMVFGCLRPMWRAPGVGFVAAVMFVGIADLCLSSAVTWLEDPGLTRSSTMMVPLAALQGVQFVTVCMGMRLLPVVGVLLATGPAYLILQRPLVWSPARMDEWLVATGTTMAMCAAVAYLRAGGRFVERLEHDHAARGAQLLAAQAEERSRSEARRVIHDDVITALRAIHTGMPAQAVRMACQSALSALSTYRDTRTVTDLLNSLRLPGLDVVVTGKEQRSHDVVHAEFPGYVLEAMRAASMEALRNVQRHSGTNRVDIVVVLRGRSGLVIDIIDGGNGLPPDVGSFAPGGFGQDASIFGRMLDVGGSAEIAARAGIGTQVRLSWHPPEPVVASENPYTVGNRRRGYLTVIGPTVLTSAYMAARHPGDRVAASLVLCALLGTAVVLVAWFFATRAHTKVNRRADATWVSTLVVTGTTTGLFLAGHGALVDFRSWVVGLSAAMTMLLAFDVGWRVWLAPLLAQELVVVAFATTDPTIHLSDAVGALTTPISMVLVSGVFGALLRRNANRMRTDEQARRVATEHAAWVLARENAQLDLHTLQAVVVPVLRAAAAGSPRADPSLAGLLATRCQDELYLPQPLPLSARTAVDDARMRGVSVNFRLDTEFGRELPPDLIRLLEELADERGHSLITVFSGDDPRIVVVGADGTRDVRRVPIIT